MDNVPEVTQDPELIDLPSNLVDADHVDTGTTLHQSDLEIGNAFFDVQSTHPEDETLINDNEDRSVQGNINNQEYLSSEMSPSEKTEYVDPYTETTSERAFRYDRKLNKSIKAFSIKPADSITVHVMTRYGILLEILLVPKTYFTSDLIVLIVRDSGLRHNTFQLFFSGEPVGPMEPLIAFANEESVVKLAMELSDPEEDKHKIRLGTRELILKSGLTLKFNCKKIFLADIDCTRQDTLAVSMPTKQFAEKRQLVTINWLPFDHAKRYLGGYRNKLTGTIYHHASSQTLPPPKPQSEITMYSRDTQTYRMKHFGQSTVNHMSTQFSKPGFFVSNYQDRVKTPGPYETADEYLARRLRHIIVLQKYWRRWLAKRRVDELRKLRAAALAWDEALKAKREAERKARLLKDLERRCHPKTKADFDRLFEALEGWRVEAVGNIEAQNLPPAERKAALALLLDEETELVGAIGRHQQAISHKWKRKGQTQLLRKAAAPIRWTSAIDQRPIEIDTPQTLRGRELLDMYESLTITCLPPDERLDLLLTLKHLVGQSLDPLCKEIVNLLKREAELIIRGVPDLQLVGLRRRIANRFVQYAKIPENNPEIGIYLQVPTGKKETAVEFLKGDIYHCVSCDRYLKNSAFQLGARTTRLASCISCKRQDNRARKRVDLQPYKRILDELRINEIKMVEKARNKAFGDAQEDEIVRQELGYPPSTKPMIRLDGTDSTILNMNPYPFLVDQEDIRFLVDQVWERRSVLSGWLNLADLVFIRWRLDEPWAPWNTMLVTIEEADAHAGLGRLTLEEAYADALLNIVNQRLVMARNAFSYLLKNGRRVIREEVEAALRTVHPEDTSEWRREQRNRLPPLAPRGPSPTTETRHKATFQPRANFLPAIRGEKRWTEVELADQT